MHHEYTDISDAKPRATGLLATAKVHIFRLHAFIMEVHCSRLHACMIVASRSRVPACLIEVHCSRSRACMFESSCLKVYASSLERTSCPQGACIKATTRNLSMKEITCCRPGVTVPQIKTCFWHDSDHVCVGQALRVNTTSTTFRWAALTVLPALFFRPC